MKMNELLFYLVIFMFGYFIGKNNLILKHIVETQINTKSKLFDINNTIFLIYNFLFGVSLYFYHYISYISHKVLYE